MKKSTRLLALLLAAGLSVGATALSVGAAPVDGEPIVEESFDDYDVDYEAKSTALFPTFVIDANSIGEGYVKVKENPDTGNLHLESHVFTQVYNAEPLVGGYTFSMDIYETQGNRNCAIFLRAPLCGGAAYYEHDAVPGDENSGNACRTGIVVNCHSSSVDVNIKSYDTKATDSSFFGQNIFTFDLPEGVVLGDKTEYTAFKAVDTGSEVSIYVADTLICRIALSEPNSRGFQRVEVSEACFKKAVIYDADGTELGTVSNTLVQAEGATVGWATRVANMIVDNVYLAPHTDEPAETVPETAPETQPETAPESKLETTPETAPVANESEAQTTEEASDTSAPDTTAGTAGDTSAESAEETTAKTGGCSGALSAGGLLTLAGAAFISLRKKH